MTCVAAVPGAPEIVLLCLVVSRSLPSKHKKLFCLVFLKLWVAGGLCPLLEFQTWSWLVKKRDCQKRGCQSRSFKEVKVSWQMTALVHPTLSPLECCDMWRWRAHELVRLVSAWQWQMGLMAEGSVCLQRCTRTAAEYQHSDCTSPAPETLFYLFVCLAFFFLLTQSCGRSQPEHCSWMDVECPNGKGELERAWMEHQEWLGA